MDVHFSRTSISPTLFLPRCVAKEKVLLCLIQGPTDSLLAARISRRKDIEFGAEPLRCSYIEGALVCRVQGYMCAPVRGFSFEGEGRIYRRISDYGEYWAVAGDCRYVELAAISRTGSKT